MSRHVLDLPCGDQLAYGFDKPMSSYFVQRYTPSEDPPIFWKDGAASVIFEWIFDYAKEQGIDEKKVKDLFPESLLYSAAMDLPIE